MLMVGGYSYAERFRIAARSIQALPDTHFDSESII